MIGSFATSGWRRSIGPWSLAAAGLACLFGLPLLALLVHLFTGQAVAWAHIAEHLLPNYVANTLWLVGGIALLTLLLGVPTAWLVAVHDFPGRRWLAWGLVLPLALPTYLAAITWAGLLDFTGPVQTMLRRYLPGHSGNGLPFDIMSLPGAVLVMGSVLYPYVYLLARSAFERQGHLVLEAARTLGRSPWQCWRDVALPLARPAIVGGVALALMETLNDYGAVKYYGVETFTTAIFRAWFGLNDVTSAIRLSACLLGAVALVLTCEHLLRGRAAYAVGGQRAGQNGQRLPLYGWRGWAATACCALPVVVGFLIPVAMLLIWAAGNWRQLLGAEFARLTGHSLLLGAATATLGVMVAVIIAYAARLHRHRAMRVVSMTASVGYAVPGAVIAIGVLVICLAVDRAGVGGAGLLVTGSLGALVAAYAVRFLAVGNHAIDAAFTALGRSPHEAARTLGASPTRTLWQVELPLLRGSLLAAFLLMFIEVIKELPLTLILRPFNFETLATMTYQYAGEEMIAQAAGPALLLLLLGLIPVALLNRLARRSPAQS